MGDNSVKNSRIKIQKQHAHLHIIGKKSTKFQRYPMKDIGGLRRQDLLDGRPDGRKDGITQTRADEGHFYSPPPPTSGDKEKDDFSIPFSVSNNLFESLKSFQWRKSYTW